MNWLLWACLSAFFAGLTAVLAKVGVAGINSHLATAIRTSVVLIFAWALAWIVARPLELEAISRKTWLFLVLSGLATGLSWICYFRALQLGEATRVASIDRLSIVIVLIFSLVFLGERLTWPGVFGVAMMIGGGLLLIWK